MKKLAIVILNWNGVEMMRQYLPTVLENSVGNVVVADNASTDGSVEMLLKEFPQVPVVVQEQNFGFAEGYNRALAQLPDYEYYLLLNSDVEIRQKEWDVLLVKYMDEHPECAACQPKLLSLREPEKFEYAGAAGGFLDKYGYPFCRGRVLGTVEKDDGQYDATVPLLWATGAALMVRASDWQASGGLDGRFFAHMEEIDLCWRLRTMGKTIVCVAGSRAYHLGGATLNQGNPRKTFLNFRNNLLMLYKNLPANELRGVMRVRRLLDYLAALQFLLKADFGNAKAVFKARHAFSRVRPDFAAERRRIQQLRQNERVPERTDFLLLWQYYVRRRKTFAALMRVLVLLLCLAPSAVKAQERVVTIPTRSQFPSVQTRVMLQDSEGYLWYGMKSDGLLRDDGYTVSVFRSDFLHPEVPINNNVVALCEDKHNRIWIGTKRGLYILDKRDCTIAQTGDKELQTWSFDIVQATEEGDTIKAYANSHLLVYDVGGRCISRTPVDRRPPKPEWRFLKERRGRVWEIDDDGIPAIHMFPVLYLQQVEMQNLHLTKKLPTESVAPPEGQNAHTVCRDKDGNEWIGTGQGLWLFRHDEGKDTLVQVGPDFGVVNTLATADDGTVYMGTERQGLMSYRHGQIATLDSTLRNTTHLCMDADRLWIATSDGRLLLYGTKRKGLFDKSEECGLRGEAILGMVVAQENVWLLFNQRLLLYSPSKSLMRYIALSDLDPEPTRFQFLYTDVDEKVYLQDELGLFELQTTRRLEEDAVPAQVFFSWYQVEDDVRYCGVGGHEITLSPTERGVRLYFTTLDHLNAGTIRFAYRHCGEEKWRYLPQGRNEVCLTQLSTGDSKIEVIATNANGQWTTPFVLTIHCMPHWWATPGAVVAYVLVFVVAGLLWWLAKRRKTLIRP